MIDNLLFLYFFLSLFHHHFVKLSLLLNLFSYHTLSLLLFLDLLLDYCLDIVLVLFIILILFELQIIHSLWLVAFIRDQSCLDLFHRKVTLELIKQGF